MTCAGPLGDSSCSHDAVDFAPGNGSVVSSTSGFSIKREPSEGNYFGITIHSRDVLRQGESCHSQYCHSGPVSGGTGDEPTRHQYPSTIKRETCYDDTAPVPSLLAPGGTNSPWLPRSNSLDLDLEVELYTFHRSRQRFGWHYLTANMSQGILPVAWPPVQWQIPLQRPF